MVASEEMWLRGVGGCLRPSIGKRGAGTGSENPSLSGLV